MRLGNGRARGALPNLVVIGAQKCGTTSLHYYLHQHPEIFMSRAKELDFFVANRSWAKGLDWYAAQFAAGAPVRGESSPSYTDYPVHTGVPARLHSIVPDAKLIYLVRDPIDRIVSQCLHDYSVGRVERRIEDLLAGPEGERYVTRSKYFMQLEQYLALFPLANILVLSAEELLHERTATMSRVFEFLRVDATFYDPRFGRIMHPTSHRRRKTRLGKSLETAARRIRLPDSLLFQVQRLTPYPFGRALERPVLDGALRENLLCELEDDANRLRELTGKEFAGWSV